MSRTLLAAYLAKHEMTQSAFAAQLGVAPAMVSLWASGERGPDVTNALAIEDATSGAVPIASWARRDRRRRKKERTPKTA